MTNPTELDALLASTIHAARVAGPFGSSRNPMEASLQGAKTKLTTAIIALQAENKEWIHCAAIRMAEVHKLEAQLAAAKAMLKRIDKAVATYREVCYD